VSILAFRNVLKMKQNVSDLKSIIKQIKDEHSDSLKGGVIVRTAAEGVSEAELRQDMSI
jgi:Ribonuclease G/E